MSGANLSGARLSGARLSGANLREAVLSGYAYGFYKLAPNQIIVTHNWSSRLANLIGTDLTFGLPKLANLSGAILREADLTRAELAETNLSGSDLSGANLSGSDLSGANLSEADLSEAKLYGARLHEAQISDITLEGAKLCGANFSGSTPHDTSLGKVDGKKPERWDTIVDNIKFSLKEAGYFDKVIDARVAEIKCICDSDLGYVSPTGVNHCGL